MFCKHSNILSNHFQKVGLPRILEFATPRLTWLERLTVPRSRSTREQLRVVRGQSLLEVLFTVAVVAILLTGVVSIAVNSVRNASFSDNNAKATRYAQEATEWLRSERDGGWDGFLINVSASGTYCLVALNWSNTGGCASDETIGSNTIFTREVKFSCFEENAGSFTPVLCSDTDVANIQTDITVEWDDSSGTHSASNSAKFTNWRRL